MPRPRQQLADAMPRAHQIATQVLPRPDEVAQGLELEARDDDGAQLPGREQPLVCV